MIIDKCKGNYDKAISNFLQTLPAVESDLAQAMGQLGTYMVAQWEFPSMISIGLCLKTLRVRSRQLKKLKMNCGR